MDVRVKALLEAGITYDDAVKSTVWSVQHNDPDGAKLFAEVAKELMKQGKHKDAAAKTS